MKKYPSFPFYPQDFLSSLDVQVMSAAEVGAFILLLSNSWIQKEQGYLPNDDKVLRLVSKLSVDEWAASKDLILGKFSSDGDTIYNPRLVSELDRIKNFRSKQAENGIKGGRPKKPEPPQPEKPPAEPKPKKEVEPDCALIVWIKANTPNVMRLKNPLTNEQCAALITDFDKHLLKEVLEAMENYKPLLSKSTNANLTIRSWITKRQKEQAAQPSSPAKGNKAQARTETMKAALNPEEYDEFGNYIGR